VVEAVRGWEQPVNAMGAEAETEALGAGLAKTEAEIEA